MQRKYDSQQVVKGEETGCCDEEKLKLRNGGETRERDMMCCNRPIVCLLDEAASDGVLPHRLLGRLEKKMLRPFHSLSSPES